MLEPEKITIVEGPTPEFRPAAHGFFQSVYEGPTDSAIALCEMRTGNGEDIRERCIAAWADGRSVVLDFPDDMRLRQEVDVVSLRLKKIDAGTVLMLWVRWPVTEEDIEEVLADQADDLDDDFDDEELDDGFSPDGF